YLTSLIDRLLRLARTDDGRLLFTPRAVDVGAACLNAARRSRGAHTMRVETSGPLGVVALADPVALEAALDALLENVSVHGGGAAELRWGAGWRRALVEVVDHGVGLAEHQRHLAFRRFFRADPVRARERGGAGLGLPIARGLVLAQAGSISLHTTPGGGLTVRIELPAGERVAGGPAGNVVERGA